MRPLFCFLTTLALAGSIADARPEGPPYFDPDRSLDKQKDAAKEAKTVALSGSAREVAPLFADPSSRVRDEVLRRLIERNDAELMASLEKLLGHKDEFVAATVAELYGQCRYADGREALEKALGRSRAELPALEMVWALEAIGSPESGKALEKAWKRKHPDSEYRVQGDALIALAVCDKERAGEHIEKALRHKKTPFQIAGLVALGRIDRKAAAEAAVTMVAAKPFPKSKRAWEARLLFAALQTLEDWHGRAGHKALVVKAVDALITRLERAEGLSKHLLAMTLADLSGSSLGDDPGIWKPWWEGVRDSFEPRDKVVEKETKKKKKKKDEDGPKEGLEPGRKGVETGGGTRVRFHGIPIHSNRIIFAQDVSGGMSMEKVDNDDPSSPTRMKFSVDELKRVLQKLPDDVMTNVVFFATIFKSTAPSMFPIKKARDKLIQFVVKESVTPKGKAMSRSNLYDTIEFAMNDPEMDTIFFLSEGGPSAGRFLRTDRFMRHIARFNVYRRVRIHTLQVSSTSWGEKFLRALSETTGGQFYGLEFLKKAHGS